MCERCIGCFRSESHCGNVTEIVGSNEIHGPLWRPWLASHNHAATPIPVIPDRAAGLLDRRHRIALDFGARTHQPSPVPITSTETISPRMLNRNQRRRNVGGDSSDIRILSSSTFDLQSALSTINYRSCARLSAPTIVETLHKLPWNLPASRACGSRTAGGSSGPRPARSAHFWLGKAS